MLHVKWKAGEIKCNVQVFGLVRATALQVEEVREFLFQV